MLKPIEYNGERKLNGFYMQILDPDVELKNFQINEIIKIICKQYEQQDVKMKSKIYTIASVPLRKDISSRMFGVFETKENAIKYIKNNIEFLSEENYYQYAVVEEYEINKVYPIPKEIFWFDLRQKRKCGKPEQLLHICNFAF